MPGDLPSEVAEFIGAYIDSVEELEILLLLHSAPDQDWTVDKVYERLRSNPQSIRLRLERLLSFRLLTRPEAESYRYQPSHPGLSGAVDGLAVAYKERRVTVIESIFSKPPSPIQGFADAFRIRKEQKNG